jgi:hypothetical protein
VVSQAPPVTAPSTPRFRRDQAIPETPGYSASPFSDRGEPETHLLLLRTRRKRAGRPRYDELPQRIERSWEQRVSTLGRSMQSWPKPKRKPKRAQRPRYNELPRRLERSWSQRLPIQLQEYSIRPG